MYGSLSSARLPPRGLSLSFPPPLSLLACCKIRTNPHLCRTWLAGTASRPVARATQGGPGPGGGGLGPPVALPPSTTSEKLPTQASSTQHAPDWTATPATPRKSWTKSRMTGASGPAASKQRPLPRNASASQRSSRRPSSARIGRDRGTAEK